MFNNYGEDILEKAKVRMLLRKVEHLVQPAFGSLLVLAQMDGISVLERAHHLTANVS